MSSVTVRRSPLILKPNPGRVLIRPFVLPSEPRLPSGPETSRYLKIIMRVLALSEEEVEAQWQSVKADFDKRHPDLEEYFLSRFREVSHWLPTDAELSRTRRLLIGSYFTLEYSLEAAALFNPSVVPAPDQSGVPEGGLRFVLSLRAVGEGHISSISFRSGILTKDFEVELSEPARYVVEARRDVDASFSTAWFRDKCSELGVDPAYLENVFSQVGEVFNEAELQAAVENACGRSPSAACLQDGQKLLMLAKSNFSVCFSPDQRYSERAIFPVSPSQTNGIEDARFILFTEDNGESTYYATYTAYDGRVIFPQLLETKDFLNFHFRTLQGPEAKNKGMGLFPRRVNGQYAMLSRQDGENIRLMYSDNLYRWEHSEILARPTQPWEFVQMGNCGSPIETPHGWLVLTHGVGAMRKYCIGALMLDLKDPSKIIGRMSDPLIRPQPEEREGYVPNVVYSCGGLVHNDHLFLPYATSDWYTSFATIPMDELLAAMK